MPRLPLRPKLTQRASARDTPGLSCGSPSSHVHEHVIRPHTAQTREDGALASGVGKRHSSHDAPRNKIPQTSHMAIQEDSRGDLHTHNQDKQVENKPFQTISNISTPTAGAFCVALPAAYVPAPPPQPAAPRAGALRTAGGPPSRRILLAGGPRAGAFCTAGGPRAGAFCTAGGPRAGASTAVHRDQGRTARLLAGGLRPAPTQKHNKNDITNERTKKNNNNKMAVEHNWNRSKNRHIHQSALKTEKKK